MSEIIFEIKKTLGVLKEYENGWAKKCRVVSWNQGPDKIDIREWSPDDQRMTRGITLTQEEFDKLKTL